jgi:hypothetical protein
MEYTYSQLFFMTLRTRAVSLCHGSLLRAAGLARAKSRFDGQLFLVRHLLILEEITRNLDIGQKDEPQGGGGGGGADQYGAAGQSSLSNYATWSLMFNDHGFQTCYPLCCRARQRTSLARSSHLSSAWAQNTSRTRDEYASTSTLIFPTSLFFSHISTLLTGNRSRSETCL